MVTPGARARKAEEMLQVERLLAPPALDYYLPKGMRFRGLVAGFKIYGVGCGVWDATGDLDGEQTTLAVMSMTKTPCTAVERIWHT